MPRVIVGPTKANFVVPVVEKHTDCSTTKRVERESEASLHLNASGDSEHEVLSRARSNSAVDEESEALLPVLHAGARVGRAH